MAGGQSLGPMLNLRLVEPERIVDISAVPELRRIERSGRRARHRRLRDPRGYRGRPGPRCREWHDGPRRRRHRLPGRAQPRHDRGEPRACRSGGGLGFRSLCARRGSRDRLARAKGPTRRAWRIRARRPRRRACRRRACHRDPRPGAAALGAVGLCQALPQGRRIRRCDRRGRDRCGEGLTGAPSSAPSRRRRS